MSWAMGMILMWGFYFPVLILLKVIFYFSPKVRERIQFEKKNNKEKGAISFAADGVKADICFEFSSEGEYQQVASLIDDALSEGKYLELVFFSPSVEATILNLYQRYPKQIRYLRYPILGLTFSRWITSTQLILVRYDFFPEFLIWSLKKGRKFKFLWVTFKKERISGKRVSLFKQAFLWRSDFTVFATQADYELGKMMGMSGKVYDFRMEQIKRRLDNRTEKFGKIFAEYQNLKSRIDEYPREKRLILGNAWPIDMDLLKEIPLDVIVVVVPHKLEAEILEEMQRRLETMGRSVESFVILNKKGVLCELYADFGKAYVGGGLGVSVHSLLEPLVAGSEHISCGPVNHRSTEFDLAQSFGRIKVVKNSQEFAIWLREDISQNQVHDKLNFQLKAYPQYQKEVLSC